MTKTNFKILSVREFSQALIDAGIIPDDFRVRRLVIDVDADKTAVVMHVEQWGDRRMIQIVPSLEGVQIHEVDRPQASKESEA